MPIDLSGYYLGRHRLAGATFGIRPSTDTLIPTGWTPYVAESGTRSQLSVAEVRLLAECVPRKLRPLSERIAAVEGVVA